MVESLGNCPNCGAPITGDACEYCGTRFKISEYTFDQEQIGESETQRVAYWLRDIAGLGTVTVNEARELIRPMFLIG